MLVVNRFSSAISDCLIGWLIDFFYLKYPNIIFINLQPRFSFTYRQGSCNTKLDALSRQFSTDSSSSEPDPVRSPSCILGAASWQMEVRVLEVQQMAADPGYGPPIVFFVLHSA